MKPHKKLNTIYLKSFLKAFSFNLAAIAISYSVGQYLRPVELLNPYGGYSNFVVKAKEVESPPDPCLEGLPEIEQYICYKFGEDYEDAMTVLSCENKYLDPNSINTYNSNGSVDEGIFQINTIHGLDNMLDYKANIDFAYKLFKKKGWSSWSCSHMVGVKPFYLL